MGMAASQVRFLSLQNRKNTIGLNLMTLSNRKTALSRDMSRVANEYNNAMNQKTLKWSNDSGVTYSDLTYDKLMKPNELNTTKPYIITDAQGRVVLDDSIIPLENRVSNVTYRDLAMMISSYSGHDTSTGKATYNNVGNLNGGTGLTSDAIRDLTDKNSIADKAESGSANTDNEYEIVTSSQNMVTNSLRYEIMSKLGLISSVEKTEIINKEMELYGSANNDKGPYPVGSLMGDYYLAKANYEACRNLLMNGEYTFAASSATNVNTQNKTYEANDGTGKINYTNTVNGTGTSISFNGQSAELSKVDLKNIYNSATNSVDKLTSKSGDITDNLSFSIDGLTDDKTITYRFATPTMLDLMGTFDTKLQGADPNKDDGRPEASQGKTWKEMYDSNYSINLEYHNRNGNTDDKQNHALSNFEQVVNEMSSDMGNNSLIQIDTAALEKARQSTIAFFEGKITNNNSLNTKGYNGHNHSYYPDNWVRDNVNNSNLITGSYKDFYSPPWPFSDVPGKTVYSVNFRNVYDTFITFYDYYHHTGADAIVNADGITLTPGSGIKTKTTTPEKLSSYTTNEVISSSLIRRQGRCKDSDGIERDCYDYFANVGGVATGPVLQRDIIVTGTDTDGNTGWAVERYFYDSNNDNNNASHYYISQSDYESIYKNQLNAGTDKESLNETTVAPAKGSLNLSYKDENGNTVSYTLSNFRKNADGTPSSIYATTITANPVDILSDLQKKVDEATAAKDAALNELDKLFAEKDSKIMDYFDALFKMISQNGWVYDENVNNQDKQEESKNYLNAKLQNNMYFITEVETLDGKDFNYATKLATNVSKVFQVYDTDAQNTALSKYESEKADINAKEKQIDIRMNKLETEQDAIKTELDSIKSIIKDNVDSTFKIFT